MYKNIVKVKFVRENIIKSNILKLQFIIIQPDIQKMTASNCTKQIINKVKY